MLKSLLDPLHIVLIYVPISIIGAWRWSYWLIRKIGARLYKAEYTHWPESQPRPTVTVVTPVYNEDRLIFNDALGSWIKNGVSEIVAVIDKSDTRLILEYERYYVPRKDVHCRLVVTPKPGKRAALCDGIARSRSDIIALVDSDTIWSDGVLEKSIPFFLNSRIGGVTVAQRIQNPDTVGNILFDMLLWTRYREEVPYLLGLSKVFNTLSGRTAFYRRSALFNPEYDNLHYLRHEHFLGTRGISGDDKRLTHLILEQGWQLGFAQGAEVSTPGLGSLKKFFKQRLRWIRNSWRADLRAIKKRWVWRYPALAIFMIDRFIQPFIMLIGPIVFGLAIYAKDWLTAGILLAWWLVSRLIKIFSYFKKYPKRLVYLPAYVMYTYANALLKIYALGSLLEHSWATRWHKSRMMKRRLKKLVPLMSGGAALVLIGFGLFRFVDGLSQASGASIPTPAPVVESQLDFNSTAPTTALLPADAVLPTGVISYTVEPGDTLLSLATRFNMSVADLKKLNGLRDPDVITNGQKLLYWAHQVGG